MQKRFNWLKPEDGVILVGGDPPEGRMDYYYTNTNVISIYENFLHIRQDTSIDEIIHYIGGYATKFFPIECFIRIKNLQDYKNSLKGYKEMLLKSIKDLQDAEAFNKRVNQTRENLKEVLKSEDFNLVDDNLHITIKGVVASDVQAIGEDLELGDLTYKVDGHNIYLISGSQCVNAYCDNSHHPHQIDKGGLICLGTASTDVLEAAEKYNFKMLYVLLKEFSECYNSDDTAGKSWTAFHPDYNYREDQIEIDGEWYDIDELYYCERFETYHIYADWSDYHYDYIPSGRGVYSKHMEDNIWDDRCTVVILNEEGEEDWVPDEYAVKYNGVYYISEVMVETDDGVEVPSWLTVTTKDGELILEEESTTVDGEIVKV